MSVLWQVYPSKLTLLKILDPFYAERLGCQRGFTTGFVTAAGLGIS